MQPWPDALPTSRQRGHSHTGSSAAALGHTPSLILLRYLHKEGPLDLELRSLARDRKAQKARDRPGLPSRQQAGWEQDTELCMARNIAQQLSSCPAN